MAKRPKEALDYSWPKQKPCFMNPRRKRTTENSSNVLTSQLTECFKILTERGSGYLSLVKPVHSGLNLSVFSINPVFCNQGENIKRGTILSKEMKA